MDAQQSSGPERERVWSRLGWEKPHSVCGLLQSQSWGGCVRGRAARKQMTSGCTVRSRKWARSLVAWLRSQLCRSLSVSAGNGRLNFSEPHTREERTISLIHCDKMHGKPLVQRTSQSQPLMNARYHETLNAPLFCASKRHPMCHPLPKEGRQLVSRLAAVVPVCLSGTPGTLTPHPR